MGVDHTGGTDTRTETTDKPAPSKQQNELPADNPGSPGQASRAESLARAREPAQWNGTQQTEVKGSGAEGAEQRDGETAESSQSLNGSQETGAPGQAKTESAGQTEDERDKSKGASETSEAGTQGRRDEEPRSEGMSAPAGNKPETDGPGDRSQPTSQSPEQRTDNHSETTDRPALSQRGHTLPADNPGSPNQPSRAESLARAREPAPWSTQQTETATATGDRSPQEHDDQPATTQAASDSPANGPNGKLETEERNAGSQGTPESDVPGRSTDGISQGRTDLHGETAENRTPSERQHTLPPDNPGSPNQPSRAESLARAREPFLPETDTRQAQINGQEQQDAGGPPTDQDPPASPASDSPQTAEQDPQATGKPDAEGPQPYHERIGENTEQPFGPREGRQEGTPGEPKASERLAEPLGDSDQPPQAPDGRSTGDGQTSQPEEGKRPPEELGEQRTTDNQAHPQELAGNGQGSSERRGERESKRGSNTESTASAEPVTENDQTDRYPTQSAPGTESGREPVVRESSQSEVELDRPSGTITIFRDRDGNIVPPNRETGQGMPEFSDSRNEDNDPALHGSDVADPLTTPDEQDLNEKGRRAWSQIERIKTGLDSARKAIASADDLTKKPPPTGHAEVKAPTEATPPHHTASNPTDVFSNSVIAGVAFIGAVREAYRGIKNRNGTDHENRR